MEIHVTGMQTKNTYCVTNNWIIKDSFQTNPSISIIYQKSIYVPEKKAILMKSNIFYAINFLFYI